MTRRGLRGPQVEATWDRVMEASEMARDMMICLYEVYREHAESVRPATDEAVRAQWERSSREMKEWAVLVDAGEGFESLVFTHPQPALMATMLGVLESHAVHRATS